MKIKHVKMVDSFEWDELVKKTYGRTYCFQQQNECQDRGTFIITIPDENLGKEKDEQMGDSIPEFINHGEMGVKFDVWLARDPKQPLVGLDNKFSLELWWKRNFYPDIQVVANDLYKKELIPPGEYIINIDW
jgi:hypothetical protein